MMTESTLPPLRVLSIGAGAIGTYIGGSLALNGSRVVFLEQPQVAQELRQRGLRLEIGGSVQRISEPYVAASLAEASESGPYDIALFALKAYDTLAGVQSLASGRDSLPPILCLQNGVENEVILEEAFGKGKVIPGTLTSAVGRRAAGDIVLERKRGAGIAAGHLLSGRLVEAFNAVGLNARLYPKAADMKWSKMLTNLLANATSAILDMTPAEVFADRDLYRLEVEQLREALRVMAAQGIRTVNLPGTPVPALAFAVHWLPPGISRPLLVKAVGGGRGGKMPSFHIDLHSGRGRSEVDYLNGAVVRFGEKSGVKTPVNRLLNQTLLDLTLGKLPLEAFARQPKKLLERL